MRGRRRVRVVVVPFVVSSYVYVVHTRFIAKCANALTLKIRHPRRSSSSSSFVLWNFRALRIHCDTKARASRASSNAGFNSSRRGSENKHFNTGNLGNQFYLNTSHTLAHTLTRTHSVRAMLPPHPHPSPNGAHRHREAPSPDSDDVDDVSVGTQPPSTGIKVLTIVEPSLPPPPAPPQPQPHCPNGFFGYDASQIALNIVNIMGDFVVYAHSHLNTHTHTRAATHTQMRVCAALPINNIMR